MKELFGKARNRKLMLAFVITLSIFFGMYTLVSVRTDIIKQFIQKPSLCINEVCTNNFSNLLDFQSGTYSDWIEIYNASEIEQSLEGYVIQKNRDADSRFVFGDMVLGAHSYIVIYCNGMQEVSSAPFKISSKGVELSLISPDGSVIDKVEIPQLPYDSSYARTLDGCKDWQIKIPSPYQSNEITQSISVPQIASPVFSLPSGFYDNEIEVQITAPGGATIYYTLDGSEPTRESDVYNGSLVLKDASLHDNVYHSLPNLSNHPNEAADSEKVDKANIIRAIAVNDKGDVSDIVTGVYFIGKRYQDICVMSLVTDPDNLFDTDRGISVTGRAWDEWYENGREGNEPDQNWLKSGRESEVEATMDFWNSNGELICSQNVGMRVQGHSTRKQLRKRYNIFSRKQYSGSDFFLGDIFGNERQVHAFTLFDSFHNMYISDLIADRQLSSQSGQECMVFLDGEYWFTYYMVEKIDDNFISQMYDIAPDNIVLTKNGEIQSNNKEDEVLYQELQEFILKEDFSKTENYDKLTQMIDMQNFCNYLATTVYLSNLDWKIDNNDIIWRSREVTDKPYEDGKWRWIINDFDKAFCISAEEDSFNANLLMLDTTYLTSQYLPNLLKSEQFKKQFALTFMDLANTNFQKEYAIGLLHEERVESDVTERFLENRFPYAAENLKDALNLEGNLSTLHVITSNGKNEKIKLNSVDIQLVADEEWTGAYFSDYPVSLEIQEKDISRFVGWRINHKQRLVKEQVLEIVLNSSDIWIEAVFQ